MRQVKFLRNHSIYNKGETAGFDGPFAEALVTKGVAQFWPPQMEQAEGAEDIGLTVIEPVTPDPAPDAGPVEPVADAVPGEPPVQGRKAKV